MSPSRAFLVAAIATVCGCGGSGPTAPLATADVSGTWAASVPNSIIVDSLVFTLAQDAKDSVSGAGFEIVRVPQPGDIPIQTPLTVVGAVSGTRVRLVINGPPRTRPEDPELFVGELKSGVLQGQDFPGGVEVLGAPVVFRRLN
jgi:hypothetical protein